MKKSILEVSSLTKSYRQGSTQIDVLNDLDLSVSEGETVAILGQSGSGKSTLLSLLAGLEKPDHGSVKLVNQEITQMNENDLARYRGKTLGIVFQQFHLMPHLSAIENIQLPLDIAKAPDSGKAASKALALVGLADRAKHLPHELSGGECQRIAIARAFVINPALLLADEPSGSLDADTGTLVMNMIFDLAKSINMTMVLVTHNEELAKLCDRRVYLEHGQLHTNRSGTPK